MTPCPHSHPHGRLLRLASLSPWTNCLSPRRPLTWRGAGPAGLRACPAHPEGLGRTLPSPLARAGNQPPRPGFTRWCLTLTPLPLSIFTPTPTSEGSGSFRAAPGLEHDLWGTQAPEVSREHDQLARLYLGDRACSRGAKQVEACLSGQQPCAQAAGLNGSSCGKQKTAGSPQSAAVPWAAPLPWPVLRVAGWFQWLPAVDQELRGLVCVAPFSLCAKLPGRGARGLWLKLGFFWAVP